jgi:hypothetical protein
LAQSVVIAETQGRRQTFRRSQLEVYFEESPQSAHRRSVAVGRGQQNAEVRSRKIVGEEARTHHDQKYYFGREVGRNAKTRTGIDQLYRGEGLPEGQLGAHLAKLKRQR